MATYGPEIDQSQHAKSVSHRIINRCYIYIYLYIYIYIPGLDLATRYSQKSEWVFQIFPFLRVIKSITRKFPQVDLILIKLIYNVKVLKSVKLKLTQVFLPIFSLQIV